MKNMYLSDLALVTPKIFPSAEATSRAAGADNILYSARVYETLLAAIADCQLVIGASARSRSIPWSEIGPRECAEKLISQPLNTKVALLFGREHAGLTNEELDCCHYLMKIPANPDFSSLNIAASVQIVAYELFIASQNVRPAHVNESPRASSGQLESFYQHLYAMLDDVGFIHRDKSRSIMRRLRRLFNRAELEIKEIDILRGILRAAQGKSNAK